MKSLCTSNANNSDYGIIKGKVAVPKLSVVIPHSYLSCILHLIRGEREYLK
jgi:hypothetical protein